MKEENIKAREVLSPEDTDFLRKPSVTIMGPFNILFRKHWDVIASIFALNFYSGMGDFSETYVFDILYFAVYAAVIYYSVRHGRRLAWNRNSWSGIEDFKRSEKKWIPWGYAGVFLMIAYSILSYLGKMPGQ